MSALRKLLLLDAVMTLGAGSAWGHHSSPCSTDKERRSKALVKDFSGPIRTSATGPITDRRGAPRTEPGGMGEPGLLSETGWKSSMLKEGDKVTVVLNPLKSGAPSGRLCE